MTVNTEHPSVTIKLQNPGDFREPFWFIPAERSLYRNIWWIIIRYKMLQAQLLNVPVHLQCFPLWRRLCLCYSELVKRHFHQFPHFSSNREIWWAHYTGERRFLFDLPGVVTNTSTHMKSNPKNTFPCTKIS